MKKTKRRAFIQTAAVSLGASTLAYPGLASAASHSERQEKNVRTSSDVRLKAMTMERIDTHSHYGANQSSLKDIVQGMNDFTQSPDMVSSTLLAIGSQKLYGINPGLFLRPDSPEEIFRKAAELRAKGPGVDSYLIMMQEMSRQIGKDSKKFQFAEGWQRHSHLGFAAEDFDPMLAY